MKKVFYSGDSIRIFSQDYVKEALKDKAEVYTHFENATCSMYGVARFANWITDVKLDYKDVDIIHFNHGIWDCCYWWGDDRSLSTPELYAENLERLVKQMKRLCPQAKLIFATTTPRNPSGVQGPNLIYEEDVQRYNAAAIAVMEKYDVEINDLHALMEDKDESYWRDHVHFAEKGAKLIGETVASVIEKYL